MKANILFFIMATLVFCGCKSTVQEDAPVEEKTTQKEESVTEQEAPGIDTKDEGGKPWVVDIEKLTKDNINFRTTKWTGSYFQMTVMSIPKGEDIGLEVHTENDQFIRIESGSAKVLMGETEDSLNYEKSVEDDWAIFIPAGYWHNIINTGNKPLKVYVIYAPAEHEKGTVHKTKEDDDHHH